MAILEEGWGIRVGNGGSDGGQERRTPRTSAWGPPKTILWARKGPRHRLPGLNWDFCSEPFGAVGYI